MTAVVTAATFLAACALAFANGANDNPKGVATLIGAGRLGVRPALGYATAVTFLGSAAALVWARGLVDRFTGKGLLGEELLGSPAMALAVAAAAAATVLLATRLGLPVSTTHALVGGLAGVGLVSGTLHGGTLAAVFVAPLVLAPLMALAATAAAYPALRRLRLALRVTHDSCFCLAAPPVPATLGEAAAAPAAASLRIVTGEARVCTGYVGTVAGVTAQGLLDAGHLVTAGAASFARGVNDTPKIAALLLLAAPLGLEGGAALLVVGAGIALGGLVAARRVAATMSHGITAMDDGQAFTANLATAALVLAASRFALPVSTTHVSVGALFGIGVLRRAGRWRMIAAILASWVAILPLAALLAAGLWLAVSA